jgi:hypothetical protein
MIALSGAFSRSTRSRKCSKAPRAVSSPSRIALAIAVAD